MNWQMVLPPANMASAWMMVGIVWFVQMVHYPLFASYERVEFHKIMESNQRRTGLVVVPPMLVLFITSFALLIYRAESIPEWQAWMGVVLTLIWASDTAMRMGPMHGKLSEPDYTPPNTPNTRLVAANRLRTAIWTMQGVLSAFMVIESAGGKS